MTWPVSRSTRKILARAALWSALSALVGTILWSFAAATLAVFPAGDPLAGPAEAWFSRLVLGAAFGGFVAVVAVPPYFLIFCLWQALVLRAPTLEATPLRVCISSLALALPCVAAVFLAYAAPSGALGPFWSEAFGSLPSTFVGAWGGIWLPRVLVTYLRPSVEPVAA